MKKQLVLLSILGLVFCGCATVKEPTRFPSNKTVETGKYPAKVTVSGQLDLYNEGALEKIESGLITVDVSAAKLFSMIPVNSDDRVISLVVDKKRNYKFKIPKNLIDKDGKILVTKTLAEQNAHISVEVEKTLVSTIEQEGINLCTYYCSTYNSVSKSCSGTQMVQNKVDVSNKLYRIRIYNDSGSAVIITPSQSVIDTIFLRTKSECM